MHSILARSFALISLAGAVQAQRLDPVVRRAVVDTVASQVERIYVDADTGRLIAGRLRERARSGAYESLTEPLRLAEQLTTDLRSVNGDLHLSVRFSPTSGGGRGGGVMAFADRSQHYALGRIDILPGNVGYMELTGFSGDPAARDIVVAGLKYVEPTSAIVFDLRRNRGGNASLVNFLISHFTGADTLASVVVKSRGSPAGFTRYTLASVPGPRRTTVPLYVLTSRGTGSAGEDFAFVLKNLKRATIVGDRTAGAGHNVTTVSSGNGFLTGISITRVSDPRTGQEWERVGVQPDVKVDVGQALETAHRLALDTLLATAEPQQRRSLELVREAVVARLQPRVVPAALLATYAGEYEGGRRVTIANGTLMYAPTATAPPEAAVAVSDTSFALSNLVRLTFVRDAQGRVQLRALLPDGGELTYPRAAAP